MWKVAILYPFQNGNKVRAYNLQREDKNSLVNDHIPHIHSIVNCIIINLTSISKYDYNYYFS